MGKKNKQRKESDNTVVNPLAPRKKNSLNPLDIEQGGGPAKSPLASLKGGGSKWKVVQKKFEDYKEAKDQQSLGGKRLISSLRDQLLDETGNPNPKKSCCCGHCRRRSTATTASSTRSRTRPLSGCQSSLLCSPPGPRATTTASVPISSPCPASLCTCLWSGLRKHGRAPAAK